MLQNPQMSKPSTTFSSNQRALSHDINLGIKDLKLTYWLRPFQVEELDKRYNVLNPRAALYIQYDPDEPTKKLIGFDNLREASFQVTENNIYEVKRVFSDALSWFEPENIEKLYGRNNEGELIFNSEFKNLNSSYVEEYGSVRKAIQIMPVPITTGYDSYEPGVILYLVRKEFNIRMNGKKLSLLANFVKDFNFVSYNQFMMGCLLYSITTGNFISNTEMKRRAQQEQMRNPNFRYEWGLH